MTYRIAMQSMSTDTLHRVQQKLLYLIPKRAIRWNQDEELGKLQRTRQLLTNKSGTRRKKTRRWTKRKSDKIYNPIHKPSDVMLEWYLQIWTGKTYRSLCGSRKTSQGRDKSDLALPCEKQQRKKMNKSWNQQQSSRNSERQFCMQAMRIPISELVQSLQLNFTEAFWRKAW